MFCGNAFSNGCFVKSFTSIDFHKKRLEMLDFSLCFFWGFTNSLNFSMMFINLLIFQSIFLKTYSNELRTHFFEWLLLIVLKPWFPLILAGNPRSALDVQCITKRGCRSYAWFHDVLWSRIAVTWALRAIFVFSISVCHCALEWTAQGLC